MPKTEQVSNILPSFDLAVEAAKAALMNHLSGVDPDSVIAISCRPFVWPNISLGYPKEGESYLPVLTPGYIIVFEAEGKQYTIHANWPGTHIVIRDFQTT